MRQIVIAMLLLAALARGELSLLPYPNHVESGSETLTLSRCQLVLEPDGSLDRSFIDILSVHHDLIFAKEHCEPKFPVRVVQLGAGSKASSAECKSEYYELAVTMESIKISAECPVGVIRGVATLWQLMRLQEEDAHAPLTADWTSNQAESKRATKVRIEQVPIHIKDSPRFEYRGLMIDSSRHFLSIATIKRVIVSMMLAKMSALHWHFVDDDSFTMQSKHIPGLAESASFHNTQFYTAEQIKDIVQFAKDRGVDCRTSSGFTAGRRLLHWTPLWTSPTPSPRTSSETSLTISETT